MTFQNKTPFSSVDDFRDVVSVLPCSPTNKGKYNLFGCTKKADRRSGVLRGFLNLLVVEPATLKKRLLLQIDWRKNGALFSFIHFFEHSA